MIQSINLGGAPIFGDAAADLSELRQINFIFGANGTGKTTVSRQETARPLLTPGEVMQLPPSDELVLVSGLLPIRAKKLRYYEDRNFTARVLPAPVLAEDGYTDRPTPRPDDWGGQVRGPDDRLMPADEDSKPWAGTLDEGGLQQQRHPGLPEEGRSGAVEPEPGDLPDFVEDDADTAADKRAMDRVSTAARVYGVDEGMKHDQDIVPGF